jgi:hypothetical protein
MKSIASSYISYRLQCVIALLLLTILCLVIPMYNSDHYYFPMFGGFVGTLCSLYVIFQYFTHKDLQAPPMALLFWRAVCDMGLGIRFLCTPLFNMMVCGKTKCVLGVDICDENQCAIASAMFEFFEIASEAWFLCIAVDLLLTQTNPFSNFEHRLKKYHIFCWGLALAFSLPTLISVTNISGFWTIKDTETGRMVDRNVFCWLRMPDNSTTWTPFVMFYLPLICSFGFSCIVLWRSFRRLRSGMSHTFVHRLRVLFINNINLTSCLVYWLICLGVYVFCSMLPSSFSCLCMMSLCLSLDNLLLPACIL